MLCLWEASHQRSERKCQHICGEDGDIYVLDRVCGGTRSKSLSNVLLKSLSSKSYLVHAERAHRRWRNETPYQYLDVGCVVCRIDQLRGTPPFYVGRGQEMNTEGESHSPRLKCKRISAIASNDYPVRSMQPQPASLVHPFSPPGHQRSDGGLDEIGVGTPAAAALACSRSSTVSDESRMGQK